MKNKVVGALVAAAWVAFFAAGCGSDRQYGEATAGTSGAESAGSAGRAGSPASGAPASGGAQSSAGKGVSSGMGGMGDAPGGSTSDSGAGGEGGSCEGSECGASCAGATPAAGTPCGECGKYACNPDGVTTSCSDPKLNACGGCGELAGEPSAACGECGKYVCAADKASVTCNDAGKNACGGCGVLANAPSSSCGACGDWQCTTDKSAVQCSGANANACGGCGTLANAPGVACGQCGKYECSANKASTTCVDPGRNACGGCTPLTGTLNAVCGTGKCGKLTCATDKNSLICTGDTPNACGGCAALTPAGAVKDGSCGTCSQKYACNADLNSLSCAGAGANVCGGCTAISGTVGASCGAGTCQVTACATDKNSLVCKSQCTSPQVCVTATNLCKAPDCSAANSCGKTDGAGGFCTNEKGKCPAKPNTTVLCAGSSCAYSCNPTSKTLSCSTTSEPRCGIWNFESGGLEGWSLATDSSGQPSPIVGGALSVIASPATGGGTKSLAAVIDTTGTVVKSQCVGITTTFCAGGAPTSNPTFGKFKASAYYKPSDTNGAPHGPGWVSFTPSIQATDVNTPANVWFDIPTLAVVGSNAVTKVEVWVCGLNGSNGLKGTLYFDNIQFE